MISVMPRILKDDPTAQEFVNELNKMCIRDRFTAADARIKLAKLYPTTL